MLPNTFISDICATGNARPAMLWVTVTLKYCGRRLKCIWFKVIARSCALRILQNVCPAQHFLHSANYISLESESPILSENIGCSSAHTLDHSTQIPETATFLNRCGDIIVLGRTSAILDRNSGLLNASLKCFADSQTT